MADRAEILEAALESRPDGVALLGADGSLVFWNRAAEAMTGYPSIEVVMRPIPEPLEVRRDTWPEMGRSLCAKR
jgi:PAS domain S-box-containing protein